MGATRLGAHTRELWDSISAPDIEKAKVLNPILTNAPADPCIYAHILAHSARLWDGNGYIYTIFVSAHVCHFKCLNSIKTFRYQGKA